MYSHDERRDFWWQWTPGGSATFLRVLEAVQEWTTTVPPDGWVTVTQAAVLLDVATVRVNEWVRERRIEATLAPDGVTVVPLRGVTAIYERRVAGPFGPGSPPGSFG